MASNTGTRRGVMLRKPGAGGAPLPHHRCEAGQRKEGSTTMAWETRGSGTYYYRKRKVNGRVISEYIGTGLAARYVAAEEAQARRERAAATAKERGERAAMAGHEAGLDAFCDLTNALVSAALLDAGYHRHHRGEWRKRRG